MTLSGMLRGYEGKQKPYDSVRPLEYVRGSQQMYLLLRNFPQRTKPDSVPISRFLSDLLREKTDERYEKGKFVFGPVVAYANNKQAVKEENKKQYPPVEALSRDKYDKYKNSPSRRSMKGAKSGVYKAYLSERPHNDIELMPSPQADIMIISENPEQMENEMPHVNRYSRHISNAALSLALFTESETGSSPTLDERTRLFLYDLPLYKPGKKLPNSLTKHDEKQTPRQHYKDKPKQKYGVG
jgi:hypothetical protein